MANAYIPAYIKSQNRKVVFDLFRKQGQLTRTGIASATGMSFPTAMKVVDFLLSKGIVQETGDAPDEGGMPGRKGKLLVFNAEAYRAIGFSFEGQYASVGLLNMRGDLIERHSLSVGRKAGLPDLRGAAQLIAGIAARNHTTPILGVGIGFPGIIHPESRSILQYSTIGVQGGGRPFGDLFPDFVQSIGMPYFLENDVNLSCVGEMFQRRRRGDVADLVYLSLGTGLGGGIVLDGQLRRGSNNRTGEVGSNIVDVPQVPMVKTAQPRRMERLVNLDGIKEKFGIDLSMVVPLDDGVRADIAEYICGPLSMAMANMVNTLDIADFVLSGVIPDVLGDLLYDRLNDQLQALQCGQAHVSPPLDPCAGITGGAVTVFDSMIFDVLCSD